jgi:HlyD family secretion protein
MKKSALKKGIKWLSISAGLTLISLGGWLIYGLLLKNNTQTITVGMTTVTQGTVEDKITGESGVLKLDNQRTIKTTTTGTVEKILVKIGEPVKKGQVLMRLRDRESQIKLQEFESDSKDKIAQISDKNSLLQKAEKKLFELTQEYQNMQKTYLQELESKKKEKIWELQKRQLEVNKKEQAILQAETDLKEAKVTLEENKQLLAKGFISESELKEQEKKVTQADTSLTNAKDELSVSKIDLQKQQLDLQSFLSSVQENNSEPQQKLKETKSKVEQAQQDVNQAKLALNQAIRELDKLQLQRQKILEELRQLITFSPTDGVILNVYVKPGDLLEQRADILLIGDPNQKIVELKLSPLDATKVKLQQQAEISIVGLESKKITGKVQQVSLLATQGESNNNLGSETVKVTAIVRLDQVDKNIVPGTTVTVALILAQKDQVLFVPNEAIQHTDTETFVWMKNSQSKVVKKPVKIGLQGLESTEITSGLKVNDEVLIPSGESPLQEGVSVKVK